MSYTVTNSSQASTEGSAANRRVMNVSGTRLYPTNQMQIDRLTSDVLEGMRSGDLRVEDENGALITEESLNRNGQKITTREKVEQKSGIDGRVRHKETIYELAEIEEESGEEAEEEDPVDAGPEDEAEAEPEATSEEDPQKEETEEKSDHILPRLRSAGVIDESVETSSDMNAKPLRALIEEYGEEVWPEGFFEEETRVTVLREIGEEGENSP